MSGMATEEEQLADVLRPFGDLVAIGQPGERLTKPGAARIYTSDAEWKEIVKQKLGEASLVVIRADLSKHVLWELKQAVATLSPQRVLILILHMKARHYNTFRAKANSVLGLLLPERTRGRGGFIVFDGDWKPTFCKLRAPYLRKTTYKPYRPLFKYALRSVFETFGMKWLPPPISAAMVFSTIGFVAILSLIFF
jgi:hypothetical protein